MSTISKIFSGFNDAQENLLGPDYNYANFIKNPSEMGINSKGTLPTLKNNMKGLRSYIDILLTGKSEANKLGNDKILGSKFFLSTGAKCIDYKTNEEVPRSLYISNTPSGFIPGLSNMTGFKASEFKGLIPGMLQNVNAINPMKLFKVFSMSLKPKCAKVNLPVIDGEHNETYEEKYIPLLELEELANEDSTYDKYLTRDIKDTIEKIKNGAEEGLTSYDLDKLQHELGYLMYLRENLKSSNPEKQQHILIEHNNMLNTLGLKDTTQNDDYSISHNIMLVLFTIISVYILFKVMNKMGR